MRRATAEDLPRIIAIYNATDSEGSTVDTERASIESRRLWFETHSDVRPIFVQEQEGTISGWLSFQDFYSRPAYNGTAEISVYVAPEYHGRGVGSCLLQGAIGCCTRLHIHSLVAFALSDNVASLALFKKYGFSQWGLLPDVAELGGQRQSLTLLGLNVAR
ncbi:GNAT family N-acetyltransferase [Marinimicrobium sp. ABcell2]|uniref:GNAT family N-acetyltransferase n=1 Tax=Marinimicrobium sp. ABcell2 TaxID=3069751 RepID=UPI0027AFCA07|nr:GNAT family N-acetyltransferase [Marinimicrobium sp. ABcell2]MDQ2076297.1 N-acetyltransferase family protein [Marinimicrobium sp. ABcell2]